ncbi:MAG: phosphoribosylformylglycinamidine cyclo-ligase [Gammaproteobacteria bacterium]|nr:phosphoribosylformylglycinamidine cyclo-ligase [Gammaproteobacteria bacterium]
MARSELSNLNYAKAGVNINNGNELVERIKHLVPKTSRPGVLGNVGGFGGLFDISSLGYKQPVLVSGTDGVGTKLKLAIETDKHDEVGIDLVAMCVNDLIVLGAEPLIFLDYYATGKLNVNQGEAIIQGIVKGCELAGCALQGGETAEMPGMYQGNDYDLAGFCVGVVEKDNIIDGHSIIPGNVAIGLASSGLHSNGFSLVRKVLEISQTKLTDTLSGNTFQDILLTPTQIYVKPVLETIKTHAINGIAHITGGGLVENIPRILPENLAVSLNHNSWQQPEIFNWLQSTGNIPEDEMYRVFNCGVGMVLFVNADESTAVINMLNSNGVEAWQMGEVIERQSVDSEQVTLV